MSTRPYYRRSRPKPQNDSDFVGDRTHIDLTNAHMDAYVVFGPLISLKQVVKRLRDHGTLPQSGTISVKDLNRSFQPVRPGSMRSLLLKMLDPVAEANLLFDKRAAAAVLCAAAPSLLEPNLNDALLEHKSYEGLLHFFIPRIRCLALLALGDYFPGLAANTLGGFSSGHVSQAILFARPGWCGTFGPGVAPADLAGDFPKGDYDMSQMHLLPIAYRYYDELTPEAREHLITVLLAQGTIHRPGLDDTLTHGPMPNDWSRAGLIDELGTHKRIGETENHILMILTARYLTNQLLYQRDHDPVHDNRRNGQEQHGPDCTGLLLTLLRDILRDDFSEYNAKPYQTQTRLALLNLCTYAYDHEVRLAARMVLDYIAAHIAVSSSDLRRMVPFRRLNESDNRRNAQMPGGFMDVGLLEWFLGADPMAEPFAMQAGNTRAYENASQARPWLWGIASDGGAAVMEALSDYRLPPSIHDLFVNDLHRRFFQRLHRVVQPDVELTGRNCDNMEIYAGSPSYLITAGGSPAPYAIDPLVTFLNILPSGQDQQIGVAVTTSFMPTGQSAGVNTQNNASDLIQFSGFSDLFRGRMIIPGAGVANYGVAPDFACGHKVHLPEWCLDAIVPQRRGKFDFVNKREADGRPGFYLALLRDGDFTVMEAFDTWLHPDLTFDQFKSAVWERNKHLSVSGLNSNVEAQYTTQNGNRLHFVIWTNNELDFTIYGAKILRIEYGTGHPTVRDPMDSLGDAGNITDKFLSGTVMNSPVEGIVEITNHFLGSKITLDMSDPWHPRRTSETGEVEEAGSNHEVWVDFSWRGPSEGDFYHPFNTIAAATAAVADGGVIKIMPGSTRERSSIQNNKRIRLVAPIGGVAIGVR